MAEQKSSDVSFRITYFPFQGRAGCLRAAASLGGISYEDEFTSHQEHKQAKEDGTRRWSGLPELTVFDKDGKELCQIGQSNSCLRYIGKLTGSYPENPVERALVDEVLDSCEDLYGLVFPTFFIKDDEEKKKARKQGKCGKCLEWTKDKIKALDASRGVIVAVVLMTCVFIVAIVFANRYNKIVADIEAHFNDSDAALEVGRYA